MFSATLHDDEVKRLAGQLCTQPTWVDLKGKDAVPETVDHMVALVSSQKDRSWGALHESREVPTDNVHVFDQCVPSSSTRESLSQGVKLLKLAKLKQLIDLHDMQLCMIFCRTNFDVDNLEQYLTSLGGGKACASRVCTSAGVKGLACIVVGERIQIPDPGWVRGENGHCTWLRTLVGLTVLFLFSSFYLSAGATPQGSIHSSA
jgi:hypothetical protein